MTFFSVIGLRRGLSFLSFGLISAAIAGCATYQGEVKDARDAIADHNPAKAVALLKPKAEKDSRDQLVFILDYATALQQAGQYQESAKAYQKAEKIAEIKDYHSISNIAASLVVSEEMVQYKGEDYEKVLINGMNAVNYLELGELDDALVEVRRLNEKLYKYKYEAKRDYEQNPYAFYLAAMVYEADRKWDDAYISYKSAYALAPQFAQLHTDLVRAAIRAQRPDDVADWKRKFPEVKIDPRWSDKSMGEIVLLYEQGWGPRKEPRPEYPRFPHLVPVSSRTEHASLVVDGEIKSQSGTIYNVSDVAIKTLDADFTRLLAMRAAGIATKAVVADQIAQKNRALGAVAWLALNVADRADLRQWSTLPHTFQIARFPARAGKYKVKVQGLDWAQNGSGEMMDEQEVEVKPGRKAFVAWRSVR